eukprot:SAG31_NODE_3736_length_3944_cov_1.151120_3_plen_171_part_00
MERLSTDKDGDARGVEAHDEIDAGSLRSTLDAFMKKARAVFFSGVRRGDQLFDRAPVFPPPTPKCRFTFAEAFAGIGGFRIGLENIGGHCVMASEIDKHAVGTYRANWPPLRTTEHEDEELVDPVVADITSFYAADLPDFDILTAGFPCHPFSVRGQRGALTFCVFMWFQ